MPLLTGLGLIFIICILGFGSLIFGIGGIPGFYPITEPTFFVRLYSLLPNLLIIYIPKCAFISVILIAVSMVTSKPHIGMVGIGIFAVLVLCSLSILILINIF